MNLTSLTGDALQPGNKAYPWRQISALGYKRSEPPELEFPSEESHVLPEVIRVHLEDLDYKIEDLCSALHTYEDDLRELHLLPDNSGRPIFRVVK